MPTSTADRSERWRHGRHLSQPLLWFFMVLVIGYDWWPGKSNHWVEDALAFFLFLTIWGSMFHSRELCERCIMRVPLDPQQAVDRTRKLLWAWHNWFFLGAVGVFAVLENFTVKDSWEERLFLSLEASFLLANGVVSQRHSALQPWCPWCRDDGDGEDEFGMVPDSPHGVNHPTPA